MSVDKKTLAAANHYTDIKMIEGSGNGYTKTETDELLNMKADKITTYTKNEVDNAISTVVTSLDWKETVNTFSDIATTYPNPEDGWTVNVKDTNITYQYDEVKQEWIPISANAIPKATALVDGLLDKNDFVKLQSAVGKSLLTSELLGKQNLILSNPMILESASYNRTETALGALATRLEATYKKQEIDNELLDKVDKVTGKGLSTEDYTSAEKTKLGNIENGAQVNSITGVKGNAETNYRSGNVNITPSNIGAYTSGQVDTLLSEKQNLILSNPMMLESHSYNRTETALGALATRLEATYKKSETDNLLATKPNIFTGTTEEWETLTPAQKQVFYGGYANFTDDNPWTSETLLASLARSSTSVGIKRMIYGGKNLGSSVSSAQKAEIKAGTFRGMTVGDYWVINGVTWVIVDFDYWLNTGDVNCTEHHVVVRPATVLYNAKMNDTNTTEGGYVGSKMFTENLENAKTTIKNAFGESNILTHREYLINSVTNGKPSGGAWYDSQIELPNEIMMYGHPHYAPTNDGSSIPTIYTIDKTQLALYQVRPDLISNRMYFWLRDVVSAAYFAYVNNYGGTDYHNASNSFGVRPIFGVIGMI